MAHWEAAQAQSKCAVFFAIKGFSFARAAKYVRQFGSTGIVEAEGLGQSAHAFKKRECRVRTPFV